MSIEVFHPYTGPFGVPEGIPGTSLVTCWSMEISNHCMGMISKPLNNFAQNPALPGESQGFNGKTKHAEVVIQPVIQTPNDCLFGMALEVVDRDAGR